MTDALGRTGTLGERDDRHVGLYRAVVADNNDPAKRGRLRLVIPEVSGSGAPHPRWAEPARGFGKGGGRSWGHLDLPEKDDVVWVEFVARERGGLEDVPVWLPGWAIKGAVPELLLTHYPRRRGLVTPSGHNLVFDDSDADGDKRVQLGDAFGNLLELLQAKARLVHDTKAVVKAPAVALGDDSAAEQLELGTSRRAAEKTMHQTLIAQFAAAAADPFIAAMASAAAAAFLAIAAALTAYEAAAAGHQDFLSNVVTTQ